MGLTMRLHDEDFDADDYREWQQDDDLALFRAEQRAKAAIPAPTPEPEDEDMRCGGCNMRRALVAGLCEHCTNEIARVSHEAGSRYGGW